MDSFSVNSFNQIKRRPNRAQYDKDAVYAVVDEALSCHVGFVQEGRALVIPMIHARVDHTLFLHPANRPRRTGLHCTSTRLFWRPKCLKKTVAIALV